MRSPTFNAQAALPLYLDTWPVISMTLAASPVWACRESRHTAAVMSGAANITADRRRLLRNLSVECGTRFYQSSTQLARQTVGRVHKIVPTFMLSASSG